MTTINTSSQTLPIVRQHARNDSTFSRKDTELKGGDPDVQIILEKLENKNFEKIAKEISEELTAELRLSMQMFSDLDYHTNKFLKEIEEEAPWILTKKFDFTNTGDEIEVINHNLDESEYNYLKGKLNDDKALVKITDWYNEALAEKWNNMSDSPRNYTKEDTAGKIHVLSVFKGTEEELIERCRTPRLNNSVCPEFYRLAQNDDRTRWALSWGQILSSGSSPIRTIA
ncbi:MAG: hypothetical protein JKY62_04145 [Desulfocapsa sp.]|nr:hypothetical protein [Desulfocapsa sp.]MBN4048554.1 hypothetical protein [bacterium AH-315-N22]